MDQTQASLPGMPMSITSLDENEASQYLILSEHMLTNSPPVIHGPDERDHTVWLPQTTLNNWTYGGVSFTVHHDMV
jgi:hypothetical protein